ncbi:MAG: mannosyltransferase [Flavobacteriaceae bacterium]|nr:mannosyltransferase [Flavobacteriaceae bacterium]
MGTSKENKSMILLTSVTVLLYFFFGYNLERAQFFKFLALYAVLFSTYFYFIKKNANNFQFLLGISILFRLVFLFSIPNLSQDFYRFIWDGRMLLEGLNPYLSLPETFINQHSFPVNQALDLYSGMGELNGSHYTNYPPINQLCFLIAAFFANKSIIGSVVVMRLLIIFADVGILYFGKKILAHLKIPVHTIFWYILNPFIIIEMTGNLHFEPVMLFFLVWAIHLLFKNKWVWAAVLIACSITVKLIPFLFLPLFFQWFVKRDVSFKKGFLQLIGFYALVIGTTIVLFLPFYSNELIGNYSNSVGLWFRNFEFNASFYYIFREIGHLFRGYNEIEIIGKIIPILTVLFVGFITFFRKNTTPKQLITALLFGLSFYYFTTTTMHPWYLATLILLSVFTKYRFPIIWSLVIILSYSAYSNEIYKENLLLISIEYIVVYGFLIWELFFKKQFNPKSINTV